MQVIKHKTYYYSVSIVLIILSLVFLLGTKLNFGIDMTGGTQTEYNFQYNDIDTVRTAIDTISKEVVYDWREVINGTSAYKVSGEDTLSVVAGFVTDVEEQELDILKNTFREDLLEVLRQYDPEVEEQSYINIGKSFGDYIKNTALLTLGIAIIAIALYVTRAFSGIVSGISWFSFSSITIITLFHDVLIASGLYIMTSFFYPEFKIDTFFVTALLTILGYSINDTIVVFDRIRSNLKEQIRKKVKLDEIVDMSVSDTVRRSIYTSLTLLLVLVSIFVFGPESISGFVLVLIFGTIVGTYSSIYIASPLLYELNKNKKLSVLVKKESSPEDKIVV